MPISPSAYGDLIIEYGALKRKIQLLEAELQAARDVITAIKADLTLYEIGPGKVIEIIQEFEFKYPKKESRG